jgi:hypothetical protein
MIRRDTDRFIYKGSPFLPGPMSEVFQDMVDNQSQFEPMWFTITMALLKVMDTYIPELLSKLRDINREFGTTPPDLKMYMLGFNSPLFMIAIGHLAIFTDEQNALSKLPISEDATQEKLNRYIRQNIKLYQSDLREEPNGRLIFLMEEDNPFSTDLYYSVGVRAAKITYLNYAQEFGARFD